MSREWAKMPQLRIAMRWTPDGQRKRGRPKETWRSCKREMLLAGPGAKYTN